MISFFLRLVALIALVSVDAASAAAQPASPPRRRPSHCVGSEESLPAVSQEKDFQLHAEALAGRSILASEQLLALESEGRGWARNMLGRLCIDAVGRIAGSMRA